MYSDYTTPFAPTLLHNMTLLPNWKLSEECRRYYRSILENFTVIVGYIQDKEIRGNLTPSLMYLFVQRLNAINIK